MADVEPDQDQDTRATGKGHPTPKRRDAEAARRQSLKVPSDPKAAKRASRERQREARLKQREAMMAGVESALPPRDRGPVKRFVRDWIDGKRRFSEYFLPMVLVVLLLTLIPHTQTQLFASYTWYLLMLILIVDVAVLVFRLRRVLRTQFPDKVDRKGATFYGVMRALQIRRLRIPAPQVSPGGRPTAAAKPRR
jgi:hypothetical protein